MSDASRYLTSLAQALAKMSLYAEGHPARGRAADLSHEQLRTLQENDAHPIFSFLGREVIYRQHALRELNDWDWAERLSSCGIQRLEFDGSVDREQYRAFLEDVLQRIALQSPHSQPVVVERARGGTPIRFGAVGLRDVGGRPLRDVEADEELLAPRHGVSLSEEADAVMWMHQEVVSQRQLPMTEAEMVVGALSAAMHGDRQILIPLLTLKEFDQYTTTHAMNVAVLAMGLAEYMGLSPREVHAYGTAGLLHDLGKVKIPYEVLRKPGALTPEEKAVMNAHPVEGAKMILSGSQRHDLCAVVAYEHHIMIDGGGYPQRQTRRDCHHASMLVHVCDVFDALRTHRPYRVAWVTPSILAYIERRIGTEFHPEVARAFLDMMTQWEVRHAVARAVDEEEAVTADG